MPNAKTTAINDLKRVSPLAAWVHFLRHLAEFWGKDGAPLDDFIRDSRIRRSEEFRSPRCTTPEAWLAAASDCSLHDFLWADDHAHRGAGTNDRIPTRSDSGAFRR